VTVWGSASTRACWRSAKCRRYRTRAHLKFVALQACLSLRGSSEPPFISALSPNRALGPQVSDEFAVPLLPRAPTRAPPLQQTKPKVECLCLENPSLSHQPCGCKHVHCDRGLTPRRLQQRRLAGSWQDQAEIAKRTQFGGTHAMTPFGRSRPAVATALKKHRA